MPQANSAPFETDPASFLERFLTQNDCWVHNFEPKTKGQSVQWKHSSSPMSPPPNKAKVVSSAGKVMVFMFWDVKGMFIDSLHKGQTINGELYYANLLRQLRKAIQSKWVVNSDEENPVSPTWPRQCSCTQVCGRNGCCAWLALNWLITLHIFLIWYQLTIFGWEAVSDRVRSYLQLRTFSRMRVGASYTTGIQAL